MTFQGKTKRAVPQFPSPEELYRAAERERHEAQGDVV